MWPHRIVLVQPEMERGRLPLASIPPSVAEIFKSSMSPPGYPSARLRAGRTHFRFAWQDHYCSGYVHPYQLPDSPSLGSTSTIAPEPKPRFIYLLAQPEILLT
jgi:hypothetical protein